jgi:hypothetical protein
VAFAPFMVACETLIGLVLGDDVVGAFATFGAKCLELDPTSMALALHDTVCVVCGDGAVRHRVSCDH